VKPPPPGAAGNTVDPKTLQREAVRSIRRVGLGEPKRKFRVKCEIDGGSDREAKVKKLRIVLTDMQRNALLAVIHAVEDELEIKKILSEHNAREAAYKAIRKLRQAIPSVARD
jgi:hypothetical protein